MSDPTNPPYDTAKAVLEALGLSIEPTRDPQTRVTTGVVEVNLSIKGNEFPVLTVVREFWRPGELSDFQRVVSNYEVKLTPKEPTC